jgi:subtilisin family serine protease
MALAQSAPLASDSHASPAHRPAGETLRDRVLVKLVREPEPSLLPDAGTTGPIGFADFDRLARELGVTRVKPVFHRPPRGRADPALAFQLGIDRWVRVELGKDRADLETIVRRLQSLHSVDLAETDRTVAPTVIPSDPDFTADQWDLQSNRVDAPSAWDTVTDSSAGLIGIIDTGVETTHTDIVGNLWVNPGEIAGNGIDDDGNGYVDDVYGWNFLSDNNDVSDTWPHGMHVNGIVGAMGDNATMVAGINWKCQLVEGKIFDQGYGTWEAGAAATTYVADLGVLCTNNSWGDTGPGPQVYVDAMDYADGVGVLQVAAAGNQGDTAQFWPAAYDELMAVASTDVNDNLSWFSTHGDWIDMAAPGENVFNLWVGNSEAWLSGTSMASPHVCGTGALVRTVNPQLTNHEAALTLRYFSDDLGAPGFDSDFGYGRLNAHKAVDAASSISLSTRAPTRPGNVTVDMDAPGEANMLHVLLAGLSGSDPGVDLNGFDPADYRMFPLNDDWFVEFQLANLNNVVTPNFVANLDANGHDSATFNVIAGRVFKGQTVSLCFATLDPNDLTHVRFVSAPMSFVVP